jgi:hypothetical protein
VLRDADWGVALDRIESVRVNDVSVDDVVEFFFFFLG